jgi:hypothetical protein
MKKPWIYKVIEAIINRLSTGLKEHLDGQKNSSTSNTQFTGD